MASTITRGWQLTKQSLAVLRKHKALIVFPLISAITCLILVSLILSPLLHLEVLQLQHREAFYQKDVILLVLLLLILFICNLVIFFCNAALISATQNYLTHKPVRLSSAFKTAFTCLPTAITWTIFNTTLGALLRFFQTRFNEIGVLRSTLAGISWTVVSYFAVPVLVLEKVSPFQAVKRSVGLLKETWGSSLVSNLGVGLLVFPLRLLVLVPIGVGLYFGDKSSILIGSSISVVLLLILHLVYSTVRTVLRCAIYHYAMNNSVIPPFDSRSLQHAFYARRSRAHCTMKKT